MLFTSWDENGKKFTILLTILLALFITPAFVKDYAPQYYGFSIWAVILYSIGLLAYRHLFRKQNKIEKES